MLKLNDLQQWLLNTSFGRNILSTEEAFYHTSVQNIFGYYALQIGMPGIDFLATNKISAKYLLDNDIKCDLRFLPFETNSIDLIICPHTLEFVDDYCLFLQECYRVLMPNGKIIINNFNPKSPFNLFGKKNHAFFKHANFISVNKLQQQLYTLNFNICGGKFFNYQLPFNDDKYLSKLEFLNNIGDRWFPTFANCYALIASKEIVTPTIIGAKRQFSPQTVFEPNLGIAGKIRDKIMTKHVIIHTDGACKGNPGIGAWAATLEYKGSIKEISGVVTHTTNNQMELSAVIKALEALKEPCKIDLYTDSQYVQKGMLEWIKTWKLKNWKNVKNVELWQELDSLAIKHTISWHWVRGHSGHDGNERVDELANLAIKNYLVEASGGATASRSISKSITSPKPGK